MNATCSAAFVKAAIRQAIAGTPMPWGDWSIVLLADSSVHDGQTLDDLTQVLTAAAATAWSVQAYEPEVEYDPGPPVVEAEPEVLPYAYLTSPPTWENNTAAPVTVRALAIVAEHSETETDDVLMWAILPTPVTIQPTAEYTPDAFSFSIVELADTPATAAWVIFETANHGLAGKPIGIRTPSLGRWKDIRDRSLGPRFKKALERLERLAYALWGSAPKSYVNSIPWTHRLNPRCFWMAEQWRQQWTGALDLLGIPKCQNYWWRFSETAAFGDNDSQDPPSVPARSQSGDWRLQMLDSTRPQNAAVFPYGSLDRDEGSQSDYKGRPLFDPIGSGDFGGDPAATPGTDGDHVVADAEDVEIRWIAPAAIASLVNSVTLHYQIGSGTWSSTAMTLSFGAYRATITGQAHGTTCAWYVAVTYTPAGGSPTTVYGPGDDEPPAAPYTFVWYYHWSPYPNGLPELWDVCAKGTDRYTFEDDEEIQPELINLARFMLDYIGSIYNHSPRLREDNLNCCRELHIKWRWSGSNGKRLYLAGGKSALDQVSPLHNLSTTPTTWSNALASAEVTAHQGALVTHDGSWEEWEGIGAGCRVAVTVDGTTYRATIADWYSQSFTYTNAEAGFPAAPNLVGLTIRFECPVAVAGSDAARKSWRGAGDLKPDDHNSPTYGGGASWETYPARLLTERVEDVDPDQCVNYYLGESAGLQSGDTIDVSHLEEIIAAIDFLCSNGLWLLRPIAYRMMTPTWEIHGLTCASHKCSNAGEPWDKPANWPNCWNTEIPTPPQGVCQIAYGAATCAHWGVNQYGECIDGTGQYSCLPWLIPRESYNVPPASPPILECQTDLYSGYGYSGYGCGLHSHEFCNIVGDCPDDRTKRCQFTQWGWAAWVCGPVRCPNGIDASHGHGEQAIKRRYYGEGYAGSCGDVAGRGNCFKPTAYVCGYVIDDNGDLTTSHDLEAETVTGVFVWPNCGDWPTLPCAIDYDECLPGGCHNRNDYPDLPGYEGNIEPIEQEDGSIDYEDLCFSWCYLDPDPDPVSYATSESGCSINMNSRCALDKVWMEVDLGIDEEITDPEDPDYGMPTLVDYGTPDLGLVPCPEMTDDEKRERLTWCPCLTATGPEQCEDWCDQELPG